MFYLSRFLNYVWCQRVSITASIKAMRLHIFFSNSPFYKMSKAFRVNDFFTIKGEVIKSDNEDNILFNVYVLELLRSQETFLTELRS